MSYVISANYHDRSSEYRWLLRQLDQEPSEAVAYKSVHATGVSFKPSNTYEQGWGCTIVAVAESATGYEKEPADPKVVILYFDGHGFRDEDDKPVTSVDELKLTEDGEIIATLAA